MALVVFMHRAGVGKGRLGFEAFGGKGWVDEMFSKSEQIGRSVLLEIRGKDLSLTSYHLMHSYDILTHQMKSTVIVSNITVSKF